MILLRDYMKKGGQIRSTASQRLLGWTTGLFAHQYGRDAVFRGLREGQF